MENLEKNLELINETKAEILTSFTQVYNAKQAKQMLLDNPEKSVYLYSEREVGTHENPGFFSRYAPSIIFAINLDLPAEDRRILYSEGRHGYGTNKLAYLLSTIDKSIMHGHASKQQMMSKVHNLNSIAGILEKPAFRMDEPDESLEYSIDEVVDTLILVKQRASALLRDVDIVDTNGVKEKKFHELSLSYPMWFKERIGDNMQKMVLYGSSANAIGNDYDNIIVVHELNPELYDAVKNTMPSEQGKPVGGLFIEQDLLHKYMLSNANNRIVASTGKLVYGDSLILPVDSDFAIVQKELYHSAMGSMQLRSAANLAFKRGEDVFGKEGLFEFFMKIPRFTLGSFLAMEYYLKNGKYWFFEKAPLMEALKNDFGYEIPKLKDDVSFIQDSFLFANEINARIIDTYYNNDRMKVENEEILKIESIQDGIIVSELDGRKVVIPDSREHSIVGEMIPVQITKRSGKIIVARRI